MNARNDSLRTLRNASVPAVARWATLGALAFGALGTACLAEGVEEASPNRFEVVDGGELAAGDSGASQGPIVLRASCDDASDAACSSLGPVAANPVGTTGDGGAFGDAGAAPAGDGGATPGCGMVNNCRQATSIGTLSGDDKTGQTTASRRGTKSEWFSVRMKETYEGSFAGPMKFSATLVSPPGANFDLYAYYDANQDVVECSAVAKQSTNPTGDTDRVELTWGEEYTGNRSDDSRTVTIEVRHVEGNCDAANAWSMVVEGYRE